MSPTKKNLQEISNESIIVLFSSSCHNNETERMRKINDRMEFERTSNENSMKECADDFRQFSFGNHKFHHS